MENFRRREARLAGKHHGQRRDHHQSAANAEHAGKETSKQTQRNI